jgi:hypothetical protein
MFTNEKLIMNLLLVFILSIFLGVIIYLSIKILNYFKKLEEIKSQEETVILDNWVNGDSFTFTSDKQLPTSLVGNEYSLTFLVYFNNLIPASKHYDQVLFERSKDGVDYDLRVEVPKLSNNPTSDLRFIFKLQTDFNITEEERLFFPTKLEKQKMDNPQESDLNTNKVKYTNNYNTSMYETIENDIFIVEKKRISYEEDETENKEENIEENIVNDTNQIYEDTKVKTDYDYIELNNNTTHKVFHVSLVIYNNIVDIYKNGQLISSKVLSGLPEINNTPFHFFKESNFNGSLNNVTYFNKALNHSEVKNDYMKHAKHMKEDTIIDIKI